MLLLGLGSNLSSSFGDRFKNIDLAISYLESYKIKLRKKSSFYETLSYPNKKNPNIVYLNYNKNDMKYLYMCFDCKNANIEPYIW